MNIYDLSRNFWDFSFENPDKIKPNHIAIYFFAVEHCNRLGWKEKFGFPTTMVMEAVGIKSYNTFMKVLKDLIDYGFIEMIEKSKNQYSANVIALSKNNKANDKALDKALMKHSVCSIKKSESTVQSTVQSIDSIDIQINNITSSGVVEQKSEQIPPTPNNEISSEDPHIELVKKILLQNKWIETFRMNLKIPESKNHVAIRRLLHEFLNHLVLESKEHAKEKDFKSHFTAWCRKLDRTRLEEIFLKKSSAATTSKQPNNGSTDYYFLN